MNTLIIFQHLLVSQLQPEKRVECDKGYSGDLTNAIHQVHWIHLFNNMLAKT